MLLFWFRRDLRLHDNAGLYHALETGKQVLPIFIFDTEILDKLSNRRDARVDFIYQSITNLKKQLEKEGSTLLVRYGKPTEVIKELLLEYEVEGIYTNRDYEPYARERDEEVKALLKEPSLDFIRFKDSVIFERSEILSLSGTPYKVYTPYKKTWKKAFKEKMAAPFPSEQHHDKLLSHHKTPLPTLQQMGFEPADIPTPDPNLAEEVLHRYEDTRNLPALDATTRLSPHLRFGTVSVREAVLLALQHSDTWLQELIWREFFMQLLFHFPTSAQESFAPKFRHIAWRNNEENFQRWCEGKTGFPLVDAGMRELNSTGFMHNRVRMVVASFLVKDLLIDWRWGEAYFAEKLLDYEQASNVGNWQWAAGTGADAQPYFRIFNPDNQVKKFDKAHTYIRRWVPEFGTSAYPEPMVVHSMARDRAIAAYKKAIALAAG
ncbi:deoxyribodipyrimidine photo-lyase [Pontibacter diazotrophicus]|uniref:Deoxyribodipyrimidine photo-lyase n=1 Tax=Pontibacter diazotrophicus TaxID=1400979 RepID=A0A3D8LGQ1_9BACT|nr:deoxyribodipyrimidine photo-lyase [Pontibacter diazotrophicus]RDV16506.1 deoxyribodipyrimidine photo-lyase [Pontibacter diazotrophicus]